VRKTDLWRHRALALGLLVPLLVTAGGVGAEGPTPVEVAASLDPDTAAAPEAASERVTVALHFAGDPIAARFPNFDQHLASLA